MLINQASTSVDRARLADGEPRGSEAYSLVLPMATWLGIPDHPRMRDVERHSRKAHWQFAAHARGAIAQALRTVAAAELDGVLYKLDGHTRSYLWKEGRLAPPQNVLVNVFPCRSSQDFHDLYNALRSPFAIEERYESVLGAFRAHKLELTSGRLRDGMVVDAFYIALTGTARSNQKAGQDVHELDIYTAVGCFRDELLALDAVKPRAEVFHGGVVAGALLGLAMRPSGLDFFAELSRRGRRHNATEPTSGGRRDPVGALLFHLQEVKESKSSWVKRNQEDLCARTLGAFFAASRGPESPDYWMDDVPPAEDIRPILQTVKQLKGVDC